MKAINIPTRIQLPFGNGAGGGFIRTVPVASQIGIQNGAASYTDGFPPLTFQPVASGGVPPFGQDMNGVLNQISAWSRWYAAGGARAWDSAFSTAIGGYPQGSIISALIPGSQWISTVDDNVTNPDTGGAGWSPYGPSTGDMKLTLKSVADYGWLLMNDGTVGNAGSGATTYANALASALFTLLWGLNSTNIPIFTSAGAPSTRGGSAAADFAALKRISLPTQLGRALAVAGAGNGLTNRTLAQFLGEETHQLTVPELAAHTHTIPSSGLAPIGGATTIISIPTPSITGSTGGDVPHNNIQPTTFWNAMIKI